MDTKTIFMAFFTVTALLSHAYPSLNQKDVDDEPLVNPGREMEALREISLASEDYNMYMLDNLPPKYLLYLNSCGGKMGPSGDECIDDVLKEIFTNKPASKECCLKVVKTGKECYMELQKFIFRLYQLKRFASQVSFRTNQVWDRCSSEVESPSSSHHDAIGLS
ncbi:hypothetical protein F2Q69_00038657 [Brassica cretica]|uniref:Prolamin-like domain-containing protein n=1 Tax=Brassica cretica TaxID=69181 RepID=A0A8S9SGS1_BRACR|nr:hypothetical protein F2Q69_00038657 [Brassica cretica]